MDITVTDAPALGRYEARSQGNLVGILEYHRTPEAVMIDHVEVQPEARGSGVAAQLTSSAVSAFEAEGIKVVPVCPYVQHWIATQRNG